MPVCGNTVYTTIDWGGILGENIHFFKLIIEPEIRAKKFFLIYINKKKKGTIFNIHRNSFFFFGGII